MRASKKTSRNYAQALLELAGDSLEDKENLLNQIKVFTEAISRVKNASEVLKNPVISKAEKKEIIKKIFVSQDEITKKMTNFLFLLIDNHRLGLITEIQNEFEKLMDKERGIVQAEISSAMPLKDDTIENLRRILEATLLKQNESLKIEHKTEESLIGGIKVKVKDIVYDGSIKGRLEDLKRRLG